MGMFQDTGLLPFKGHHQWGHLHSTRKLAAIRLVQDEFHTESVWTRKFLSHTHGNNRRLYLQQLGHKPYASEKKKMKQQAAAAAMKEEFKEQP